MGLFDRMRDKLSEPTPDAVDAQRRARDAKIGEAWAWLRNNLDTACDAYQREGNGQPLQDVLVGSALQQTVAALDGMRASNCVWAFPTRSQQANERIQVMEVITKPGTSEGTIIMRVYFNDFSTVTQYNGHDVVAQYPSDGGERAMQVHMEFDAGGTYYISRSVPVDGAL